MIESVGGIGTGNVGGVVRPAAASSASSAPSTQSGLAAQPLSPRMTADPVAGVVIAEYLSSDGEITVQFPSTTVVAYLRSGLSANGMPVEDQGASVQSDV